MTASYTHGPVKPIDPLDDESTVYALRSAMNRIVFLLCAVLGLGEWSRADVGFRVRFDHAVRSQPATGRLVVYLIKPAATVGTVSPADGPFFDDPQPMFGLDVASLAPGEWVTLNATSLAPDGLNTAARPRSFPSPLADLPPGIYKVQAVLDLARHNSSWRREPGNLYSTVGTFHVLPDAAQQALFDITLSHSITDADTSPKPSPGVEYFHVRSDLLSVFRSTDVFLHAGVVIPIDYDPTRPDPYPAIYEIPGFGGDHSDAANHHARSARTPIAAAATVLRRNSFSIVLDPEGPNGHHLFVNSANNGPVADALINELIPALEKKYHLAPVPAARLLRGHSSGGWSSLWLATQYPDTFGATWSSSPDPVDFRKFQRVDLYNDTNAYTRSTAPIPSYRSRGTVKMSVAQENAMEEVIGPDNTSAQQWDSWFAAFGPRTTRATPAAVWHHATGVIDHVVAEQYKPFDIAQRLRKNPAKFGPTFKQRVRLFVGDQDNYYLNEAVDLLRADVDQLNFISLPEGTHGFISILPGKDHASIFSTNELRSIPNDMLDHLKRNGLIK